MNRATRCMKKPQFKSELSKKSDIDGDFALK
jgi:hypothetical protein